MSEKADYISIGQHIAHTIGEHAWSNDILEDLGRDFYDTLALDASPRMLLKLLLLLSFAISCIVVSITIKDKTDTLKTLEE